MEKDPRFSTPEIDHSMNIIKECDKEVSQMRRMLSFSNRPNLIEYKHIGIRRTDEFLNAIGSIKSEDGKKRISTVQDLDYVIFNIMGETSFGDSLDLRLKRSNQASYPTFA